MLATANLSRATYQNLIELMAGESSTTNGWDVIASFDISAINKVFADSHASGKLMTSIDWTLPFTDVDGSKHLIEYKVTFGAPTLQFPPAAGLPCTLVMPITGGTFVSLNPANKAVLKTFPVPAGYSLIVTVPLCAMYGDGTVATNPAGAPSTTGQLINIGASQNAGITLHFKMFTSGNASTGAHFTVCPALPDDWQVPGQYLLKQLYTYFANDVQAINYSLTSISNLAAPGAGIKIEPKSFIFTTTSDVLSLYIQTVNSGNPVGSLTPVFCPNGVQSLPIPQGKSASLIFSQQFIESVYFVPTLNKYGSVAFEESTPSNPFLPSDPWGYTDPANLREQFGIAAALTYNTPLVEINMSDDGFGKQFDINDLIIDFSKWPYHVALSRNQGLVTWLFVEGFKWTSSDWIPDPGGGADKVTKTGTKMIIGTLSKHIYLTDVDQDSLHISFDVAASDYGVFGFGDDSWSPSKAKLDTIRDTVVSRSPTFTLDFGGLNFFAVKTIVFPSGDCFRIDTGLGISVPRDLILVGDIT